MADYSQFYEARKVVSRILEQDFIGPVSKDECLAELPVHLVQGGHELAASVWGFGAGFLQRQFALYPALRLQFQQHHPGLGHPESRPVDGYHPRFRRLYQQSGVGRRSSERHHDALTVARPRPEQPEGAYAPCRGACVDKPARWPALE